MLKMQMGTGLEKRMEVIRRFHLPLISRQTLMWCGWWLRANV
jgi:hypothetical protein